MRMFVFTSVMFPDISNLGMIFAVTFAFKNYTLNADILGVQIKRATKLIGKYIVPTACTVA